MSDIDERIAALRQHAVRWPHAGVANDAVLPLLDELERLRGALPTPDQLEYVCAGWDQTEPEIQRHIVVAFGRRAAELEAENERLRRENELALGDAATMKAAWHAACNDIAAIKRLCGGKISPYELAGYGKALAKVRAILEGRDG